MSLNSTEKREIGERLSKVIMDKTGGNSRQFALKIGMDPSQLTKVEKGEIGLSYRRAMQIKNIYNIDIEWLIAGEGPEPRWDNPGVEEFEPARLATETPISQESANYLKKRQVEKNLTHKKNTVPFYDAEAVGGVQETDMSPIHAPAGTIDIGDLLHDSQAAIRIYGNSMLPNYPPGCVVGLVKINDSFIEPGEVYVIETRDRRILKRLFYKDDSTDGELITCYSDNIMKFEGGSRNGKLAYPPFDLPKKEIKNIFVVTGVIKRNTNSVIINR